MRECGAKLEPVLADLFHRCMISKTFLDSLKLLFYPIPKEVDRSNLFNYRLISVTFSVSKVFKSLLNTQILKLLERCKLLSDNQYGVRKAHSLLVIFYGFPHCDTVVRP